MSVSLSFVGPAAAEGGGDSPPLALLSTNQSSGRRGGVRRDEMCVEWKFHVPANRILSCSRDEPSGKSAQPRTHPGFVIGGCPEQWPGESTAPIGRRTSSYP